MDASFWELLDEPVRSQIRSSAQLTSLLGEAIARAESGDSWSIPDRPRWYRYLAARLPQTAELEQALRGWRTEDLRFCQACAEGDIEAVTAFHAHYLPVIASTLHRLRLKDPLKEEVQDQLVIELLVGAGDRPPSITTYHGLGKLSHWLRVVTSRVARRALGQEKRTVPSSELLADKLVDHRTGVELSRSKQVYLIAFREAFRQAIGALDARAMNLLKQRYVDELSLQQVGAIYRVHHSTALRWLVEIKRTLLQRTRQGMGERLRIPDEDWSTIFRLIQDDLDVSLRTFFRRESPPDAGPRDE